jgi:hypothetical protein
MPPELFIEHETKGLRSPIASADGVAGGWRCALGRATREDWDHYYVEARRRRRSLGRDPIASFLERRDALEKRRFIAASLVLLGVVAAYSSLLLR